MTTAPIAPKDVFNAHGLYASPDEPHARKGNHIRATSNGRLGLPVAPFMYWRSAIGRKMQEQLRTDVTYRDQFGRLLTAPPRVSPDQPVTVEFPTRAGESCIWAQVMVDTNDLDVEAYTDSAHGPVAVGVRSEPPYALSSAGIVRLEVTSRTGSWDIYEVRWLDLSTLPDVKFEPWTMTNLPHPSSPRYLQVDNWESAVERRIREQAPRREPFQEVTGRPAPAALPEFPVADAEQYELDRLESLTELARLSDLPSLLNDVSKPQRELVDLVPIEDQTGKRLDEKADVPAATFEVNRLNRTLAGTLDPGAASALGFKAFDPWQDDPRLMIYFVEGIFEDFTISTTFGQALDTNDLLFGSRLTSIDGDIEAGTAATVRLRVEAFLNALPVPLSLLPGTLDVSKSYSRFGAWCVVDERAPMQPPSRPVIDAADQVRWMPIPPPDAQREVRLELSGLEVGGLMAIDRSVGGTADRINAENADGYHLPIVLGLDTGDGNEVATSIPGHGFVTNPVVPPDVADYGVAQQDRFGRWSNWTSRSAAVAPRPGPPTPIFQGYSVPPDPMIKPLGAGQIRVIVQIPAPDSLAPAAFPVGTLRLEVDDSSPGGASSTTTHVVGNPTTVVSGDTLDLLVPAPQLAPTERRMMRLTARWVDTNGVVGDPSQEQLLELVDPRPPAQLTVPDTLLYTGRPDVTGLAWSEHHWSPQAGQAKAAVYYADESRVTAMLERAGKTAFLNDLAAAADDPARATVYRTRAGELTEAYFERIEGAVVETDDGDLMFRHAVSGSLAGFGLYRIGTESSVGAAPLLATLPILVFSVPNTEPPPVPIVDVVQADGASLAADITIRWEPGLTTPHRYRLRRSRAVSSNPLRMPEVVAADLTVAEVDADTITVNDTGSAVIAPTATLRPWTNYSWVAEFQAPPEPGSVTPVAGRWSRPSAPFSMLLTPPESPAPVSQASASGTGPADRVADVSITVQHPTEFDGGSVGPYRLVIMRRRPGAVVERVGEFELTGSGPHTVDGTFGAQPDGSVDVVTADTTYSLTIVDPIGRTSPTFDITSVSH